MNGLIESILKANDKGKIKIKKIEDNTDKEVLEKRFIDKIELSLKAIRPFLNYMTDVLTTDENGESIY